MPERELYRGRSQLSACWKLSKIISAQCCVIFAAAKARVQTVHSQGKNHPEASQRTALQTHTGPGRVRVSTLTGKTQDSWDWESTQKVLVLVLWRNGNYLNTSLVPLKSSSQAKPKGSYYFQVIYLYPSTNLKYIYRNTNISSKVKFTMSSIQLND